MISYAQNAEDVVLHRLTRVVDRGCYIDVGAGHPVLENVTYALYLEGWRGVNVEPMSREVGLLREERPEDVTLQIALAAEPGRLVLYEAPAENRGATTSQVDTVDRYRADGQRFTAFEVETMTLAEVWDRHVQGAVHVVKIDVEGMELDVLRGADLPTRRPWTLVVEATAPNSPVGTWSEWEPLVIDAGYELVLFDGLNRFYVHRDHRALSELLSTPANVFDQWSPHRLKLAEDAARGAAEYAASLEERARRAEEYAATLEQRANVAETYAASLEARVAELIRLQPGS